MSERIKRHVLVLGACAGLLAGCMHGDGDDAYADYDDALAQHAGPDAGAHPHADDHAGHDAGAAHDAGSHAGHDAGSHAGHADGGMQHGGSHELDGGSHAGHADGGMQHGGMAKCSAAYPLYRPGLSRKVGDYTIELVSAVPAPPRQQVPNDWVMRVLDAAGQPLAGAKIDNADTFMSVHGHGGAFDPIIEPGAGPGEWKLIDLDFTMRGPWEVSFDLIPAGATRPVLVVFNICVE